MQKDTIVFKERAARTRYMAETFGSCLKGRILDVGCDQCVLKTLLHDIDYTGIDVAGTPDLQIDLEKIERLPFDDSSFDTVTCTDVLEHLDNMHAMFHELLRVAGRYVIIALPNCWVGAHVPIARGYGTVGHYGLSIQRPADRHKWFFNYTEACAFLEKNARVDGWRPVDWRVNEKPKLGIFRALRHLRYPTGDRYLNRYAHTIWTVLEKHA